MPSSLTDKLASLGVRIGADQILSQPNNNRFPIEEVVNGSIKETPFGSTFFAETFYPINHHQGNININLEVSLERIGEWLNEPRIPAIQTGDFVFIDTETSGLSGGTGTFAFLIGAGRFTENGFHLIQIFLRDPIEEMAQLITLSEFLTDNVGLVTFNGKAFDIPLLNTRYIINGDQPPFKSAAHIDLLILARRLWRDRLSSRRLGDLENHILGYQRSEEDVPGWLVPSLYFDYLRGGDARPLKSVFYHNAMDIISMAALLNHIAMLLEKPFKTTDSEIVDMVAVASLFQELGHYDQAAALYSQALEIKLPVEIKQKAIFNWSLMEKRRQNHEIAVQLWEQAAADHEIFAHIELAKYYEHKIRDYDHAIYWTETALELINSDLFSKYERDQIQNDILHRLGRLQYKRMKDLPQENT